MKQPCELVVARFLPALRATIVRTLLAEYRLKQADVARAMGLTQAAVSHYAHATRGTDEEVLTTFPELGGYARAMAREIARGASEPAQVRAICDACEEIRGGEKFCRFHAAENHHEGACNACGTQSAPTFVAFPALTRS